MAREARWRSERIQAVAEAMVAGGHFALGGNGGAPDLIRELERRGWTVARLEGR